MTAVERNDDGQRSQRAEEQRNAEKTENTPQEEAPRRLEGDVVSGHTDDADEAPNADSAPFELDRNDADDQADIANLEALALAQGTDDAEVGVKVDQWLSALEGGQPEVLLNDILGPDSPFGQSLPQDQIAALKTQAPYLFLENVLDALERSVATNGVLVPDNLPTMFEQAIADTQVQVDEAGLVPPAQNGLAGNAMALNLPSAFSMRQLGDEFYGELGGEFGNPLTLDNLLLDDSIHRHLLLNPDNLMLFAQSSVVDAIMAEHDQNGDGYLQHSGLMQDNFTADEFAYIAALSPDTNATDISPQDLQIALDRGLISFDTGVVLPTQVGKIMADYDTGRDGYLQHGGTVAEDFTAEQFANIAGLAGDSVNTSDISPQDLAIAIERGLVIYNGDKILPTELANSIDYTTEADPTRLRDALELYQNTGDMGIAHDLSLNPNLPADVVLALISSGSGVDNAVLTQMWTGIQNGLPLSLTGMGGDRTVQEFEAAETILSHPSVDGALIDTIYQDLIVNGDRVRLSLKADLLTSIVSHPETMGETLLDIANSTDIDDIDLARAIAQHPNVTFEALVSIHNTHPEILPSLDNTPIPPAVASRLDEVTHLSSQFGVIAVTYGSGEDAYTEFYATQETGITNPAPAEPGDTEYVQVPASAWQDMMASLNPGDRVDMANVTPAGVSFFVTRADGTESEIRYHVGEDDVTDPFSGDAAYHNPEALPPGIRDSHRVYLEGLSHFTVQNGVHILGHTDGSRSYYLEDGTPIPNEAAETILADFATKHPDATITNISVSVGPNPHPSAFMAFMRPNEATEGYHYTVTAAAPNGATVTEEYRFTQTHEVHSIRPLKNLYDRVTEAVENWADRVPVGGEIAGFIAGAGKEVINFIVASYTFAAMETALLAEGVHLTEQEFIDIHDNPNHEFWHSEEAEIYTQVMESQVTDAVTFVNDFFSNAVALFEGYVLVNPTSPHEDPRLVNPATVHGQHALEQASAAGAELYANSNIQSQYADQGWSFTGTHEDYRTGGETGGEPHHFRYGKAFGELLGIGATALYGAYEGAKGVGDFFKSGESPEAALSGAMENGAEISVHDEVGFVANWEDPVVAAGGHTEYLAQLKGEISAFGEEFTAYDLDYARDGAGNIMTDPSTGQPIVLNHNGYRVGLTYEGHIKGTPPYVYETPHADVVGGNYGELVMAGNDGLPSTAMYGRQPFSAYIDGSAVNFRHQANASEAEFLAVRDNLPDGVVARFRKETANSQNGYIEVSHNGEDWYKLPLKENGDFHTANNADKRLGADLIIRDKHGELKRLTERGEVKDIVPTVAGTGTSNSVTTRLNDANEQAFSVNFESEVALAERIQLHEHVSQAVAQARETVSNTLTELTQIKAHLEAGGELSESQKLTIKHAFGATTDEDIAAVIDRAIEINQQILDGLSDENLLIREISPERGGVPLDAYGYVDGGVLGDGTINLRFYHPGSDELVSVDQLEHWLIHEATHKWAGTVDVPESEIGTTYVGQNIRGNIDGEVGFQRAGINNMGNLAAYDPAHFPRTMDNADSWAAFFTHWGYETPPARDYGAP